MRYYSIDSDGAISEHSTLNDACKCAEDCLSEDREVAQTDGEWPDGTDNIEYGIIVPYSSATVSEIVDGSCDYTLQTVKESSDVTGTLQVLKSFVEKVSQLHSWQFNDDVAAEAQILLDRLRA